MRGPGDRKTTKLCSLPGGLVAVEGGDNVSHLVVGYYHDSSRGASTPHVTRVWTSKPPSGKSPGAGDGPVKSNLYFFFSE